MKIAVMSIAYGFSGYVDAPGGPRWMVNTSQFVTWQINLDNCIPYSKQIGDAIQETQIELHEVMSVGVHPEIVKLFHVTNQCFSIVEVGN